MYEDAWSPVFMKQWWRPIQKELFLKVILYMPIALLIVLLIGGGTTIAAEQTLPGDTLYPMKVEVNEQVRSAFAVSSEAQAKWDTRRTERRLEEAEQLMLQARLTAEAQTKIETQLEENFQSFDEQQTKLKAKNKHAVAAEAGADLESSLRVHEQILATIASQGNLSSDVDALIAAIRIKADEKASARITADAELATAGTEADLKAAAEGKMGATTNKIAEVRKYVDRKSSSVDAQIATQARAQLTASDETFARGKTQLEAEAYADAFASFQEASRTAQEAKLLVATSDHIKLDVSALGVNASLSTGSNNDDDDSDLEDTDSDRKDSDDDASLVGASVEAESDTEVEAGNGSAEAQNETRGKVNIDLGL
ncbi:MAG: hypothetical protein A2408_02505 [Candidatus Yonathbacteria bacterium RIFOXYC1_FULL_52_10]|uniref:Uncharacterized protein n=1 Tax=Candidatus Yonathbacteria bacterium RIFOXYD1_FULL_52_36 TaxID=1802730 RepID=A0A1G2SKA0_9BACT|nr:MAG: hypothetical protein A2408_02505 [Candidatus Yonathbacteria bacterium RIFOXYC1_FULL_52_10]OHA85434.1 MAG: hypothetical protein A2591_03080 [Candidatus Yonathbacteria bacterium RIFOXYD1_FULL_52_36]